MQRESQSEKSNEGSPALLRLLLVVPILLSPGGTAAAILCPAGTTAGWARCCVCAGSTLDCDNCHWCEVCDPCDPIRRNCATEIEEVIEEIGPGGPGIGGGGGGECIASFRAGAGGIDASRNECHRKGAEMACVCPE